MDLSRQSDKDTPSRSGAKKQTKKQDARTTQPSEGGVTGRAHSARPNRTPTERGEDDY